MTIAKNFNITESKKLQFSARFINIFSTIPNISADTSATSRRPVLLTSPAGINTGPTSSAMHSFLEPQSAIFLDPSQAFSSNPRQLALALKFIF